MKIIIRSMKEQKFPWVLFTWNGWIYFKGLKIKF